MNINPFTYGDPVTPDQFIGRKKSVRRVVGRIAGGQSSAIIGDPHIGKTSLLTYLTTLEMRTALYGEQAQNWYFSSLDAHMFGSHFTPADFWEQALMPLKDAMFPHHAEFQAARAQRTDAGRQLPFPLYQQIVQWLLALPNCGDQNAYRSLMNSAGLDARLQHQIHVDSAPSEFFHTLVPILYRYGKLNDGRHALSALLNAAQNIVGQDGQAVGGKLIQEVEHILQQQATAAPQPDDSSVAKYYAVCADNGFGNFTLERLFTKLHSAGQRFVLFLDEFDALLHHPVLNSVEFYGGLRSLASRCRAFTLVIASRLPVASLNTMTQEFNPTGSPFFNIFAETTLGPLAEKDANALFARSEDRFDAKEKAFLTTLAGRHPFLLQAASALLWETFEEEDLFHPEKIRAHVATRLYREFDHFFSDTWKVWTPEMRKAFTAVAIAHQAALLPNTKFRLSGLLKEFQHWGPELGDLEERGLIKKDSAPGTGASASGGSKTGIILKSPGY